MSTMKRIHSQRILASVIFLLLVGNDVSGQYLETFSIANKGVLAGPCGSTAISCASSDFSGVDWTINGDFSGFDSNDFYNTDGTGVLFAAGDIDGELCYESPVLDISAVAGAVSLSVFISWVNHDIGDYVDVEYQIDGGAWSQIPNQFGGGGHTIEFLSNSQTGSGSVTQGGLAGSNTLSVRVCVRTNTSSSGESTTIDNVSVPEVGVAILPVELISFKAQRLEDAIALDWSSATETNNEKFEIEFSTSGKAFEKIGEIAGAGTTLEISNYSFMHNNPFDGQNYYRLKQVDFDGRFAYSDVLNVNVWPNKKQAGPFYPNPVNNGRGNLDFFSLSDSELELSIYNIAGEYISNEKVVVVEGANNLNFNFSELEGGVYFVQLGNELNAVWRKLVIR